MSLKDQALKEGAKPVRTFYCSIPVSGFLPGGIKEWPSYITEPLLECMERIQMREKLQLKVIASACRRNPEGYSVVVEAMEDRSAGVRVGSIIVPWRDLNA